MKNAMLAGMLLAFSGCATVGTLRQDEPQASYTSSRSVPALEQCLAGALSWIEAPSIIHGEGTSELAFGRGFGDSFLLVSLRPSAGGSIIEAREQDHYGGRVRRSVESCR